jgi:ribosome-binding factor A
MAARAFIRSQIRERMGVRHVPDLTFAIDRSERMTGRMDELLGRLRKRDRRREEASAKAIESVESQSSAPQPAEPQP